METGLKADKETKETTPAKTSFLTKNILLLSFISLLTDVASEMLYPIMPLFLQSIGYGVVVIGFLEGFADAFSGLTKGLFGYLSDRSNNKSIFIKIGYGISAFAKPILGLTTNIGVIFGARMVDRFGKGIRTAPRDAILSVESSKENRGKVFGFHRSMDTLGATIGPLLALAFLYFYPSNYKNLFFFAFIPGVIALTLTLLLKKTKTEVENEKAEAIAKVPKEKVKFREFLKTVSPSYKKLLAGLLLLALLNSSDMFLLLRAKELGMSDVMVVFSYILYNLVFTIFAFPLGYLSDKLGFKKTFIFGLIIFSTVYACFGRNLNTTALLGIFALYGIFTATYEAVAKAWLSTLIPNEKQGTGLGFYMSMNSLAFLVSSLATGILWQKAGAQFAFSLISILSIFLILYFLSVKIEEIGGLKSD
jgi:MFS family permease